MESATSSKTFTPESILNDPDSYDDVLKCSSSYPNWLKEVDLIKGEELSEKEILDFIQGIERKSIHKPIIPGSSVSEAAKQENVTEKNKDLSFIAYEHAMNVGSLSFFYSQVDNFLEAKFYLDKARNYVAENLENGSINNDHAPSFDYIFSHLELFEAVKEFQRKKESEEEKHDVSDSNSEAVLHFSSAVRVPFTDVSDLSAKGQAGILGIQQLFFGLLRTDFQLQINLLYHAIKLDPEFHQWYLDLHTVLRYQRRRGQYHHYQDKNTPSQEETEAIIKANQYGPMNPRCMVGEIQLLAEIVKSLVPSNSRSRKIDFEYNGIRYQDIEMLVKYIRQQTKKILAFSSKPVRICSTINEIFTKLLPHEYREQKLGIDVLMKSLAYHPYSAKINHRLAEMFLEQKNFHDAQEYFDKAVEYSAHEGNFSSTMALIQVLMRDCEKYESRLFQIINEELESHRWNVKQKNQLLFSKSLVFLALSMEKDALDILCEVCVQNPDALKFDDIPYQSRRYGWRERRLKLTMIRFAVQREIDSEESPTRRRTLVQIRKNVQEALRKEEEYQRSRFANYSRNRFY